MVEFKISTIAIMMLFFSGVILGMSGFYMGLSEQYGKTPDDLSYLDVSDEIWIDVNQSKQVMKSPFTGIPFIGGIIDLFYTGLISVWNAMTIMMGTSEFVMSTATESGNMLHFPEWFTDMIMTIIGIIVLVALIAIITKREV